MTDINKDLRTRLTAELENLICQPGNTMTTTTTDTGYYSEVRAPNGDFLLSLHHNNPTLELLDLKPFKLL